MKDEWSNIFHHGGVESTEKELAEAGASETGAPAARARSSPSSVVFTGEGWGGGHSLLHPLPQDFLYQLSGQGLFRGKMDSRAGHFKALQLCSHIAHQGRTFPLT